MNCKSKKETPHITTPELEAIRGQSSAALLCDWTSDGGTLHFTLGVDNLELISATCHGNCPDIARSAIMSGAGWIVTYHTSIVLEV